MSFLHLYNCADYELSRICLSWELRILCLEFEGDTKLGRRFEDWGGDRPTGRLLTVDPVGAAKPNLLIGESTSQGGGALLSIPNRNLFRIVPLIYVLICMYTCIHNIYIYIYMYVYLLRDNLFPTQRAYIYIYIYMFAC